MVFAMQEQLPREYEIKRFDLPNMTHREMDDLLKSQLLCRITFHDEPYPYMLPMEYYYFGDTIYFHFTMTGRKIELMSKNPNVTVEIDWYDDMLTDYKSVILRGSLCRWITRTSAIRSTWRWRPTSETGPESSLSSKYRGAGRASITWRHPTYL